MAKTQPGRDPNRIGKFLFVDLYHQDLGGKPNWEKIRDATSPGFEYVGAILKATQGAGGYDTGWFLKNWPAVQAEAPARYGIDWFRGAYHYLEFQKSGVLQAQFFCKTLEKAGGIGGAGDLLPVVDVERGQPGSPNYAATAEQVTKITTAFAGEVLRITGRPVMLYGRGIMRDLHITEGRMGCAIAWNPSWTKKMEPMTPYGWPTADIGLWQYSGDGIGALPGYPKVVPGVGSLDLSVYVDGPHKPTLASLRKRLIGAQAIP